MMKRGVRHEPNDLTNFLPDDVWNSILLYIRRDQRDLLRLSRVCQRLGTLVYNFIRSLSYMTRETPLSFLLKLENLIGLNSVLASYKDNPGTSADEKLKLLTKLTNLAIPYCDFVTNNGISTLTNLTYLEIASTTDINDLGLCCLTNLTYLDISDSPKGISDESISKLLNLKQLIMFNGGEISNSTLSLLTNLTCFKIDDNIGKLTESSLYNLTNLRVLDIWYFEKLSDRILTRLLLLEDLRMNSKLVTNQSLQLLTNLTILEFGDFNFTSDALLKLTNLTNLSNPVETATDELLSPIWLLPKLTTLQVEWGSLITNNVISKFTNLTYLNIEYNKAITDDGVRCLTNLKEISYNENIITTECLRSLPLLMDYCLASKS